MKSGSGKKRAARRSTKSGGGSEKKKAKRTATPDNNEISKDSNDEGETPTYNLRQRDPQKHKRYSEIDWDVEPAAAVEGEIEVRATTPDEDEASNQSGSPRPPRASPRTKEQQALLPKQLKDSLKRLKNLLKLPKARRWAYCEYFIADLDRVLLQSDEEFRHCLRESFPDLRTRHLRRAEWRQVRRLIGKPRRYSQAFLEYERDDLEKKRGRIRDIQKGAALTLDDEIDTPLKIPKQLVVGARVFARVRFPKDGIFTGTVDAVMDGRYRIIFDKDVVMPLIVSDYELMSETPDDLVPVSFFLEKNKAAQPTQYRSGFLLTCEKLLASDEVSSMLKETGGGTPAAGATASASSGREERCGNYPLRMIVILIKLSKLIEKKKKMLVDLREMNTEGERLQLRYDGFQRSFQEKYACTIMELEQIDKQIDSYLIGVSEYVGALLPQMTEVTVTSRPEALQKFCQMHAAQIVKLTNSSATLVESRKTLELVTSLTAMMLQIRALGQQQCTAYELNSLKESIEEIKIRLDEENESIFEDAVEVNIKHIEMSMKGWRGIGPTTSSAATTSATTTE